ncbi:MAG: InlB B-repeat-containing protein, partial [Clostridia bacterium]|nr:InlB B-repeat-containing protein [Clostridia bacterium]
STAIKSDGKYYEITKDIYINEVSENAHFGNLSGNLNWLQGYGSTIATASAANSFAGTLDGGNNTIYGLYIVDVTSAGLFPAISSHADIKNIRFDGVHISGGKGYGGAIAGQAFYSDWEKTAKISNCSLVNATIGESANIEFVGGFIGDIKSCTVTFTNCYSYDVNLSDYKTPGGIVGNRWTDGTINIVNSYSIGYFPVRSKAKCTNVYTDTAAPVDNTTENVTVLNNEQMKGENAKTNMKGFDFDRTWKTVEDGYPVLFQYERPGYVWDGTAAESFAGGDGTPNNPYLIETASQLYKMVTEYSTIEKSDGKYFEITKDIYINEVSESAHFGNLSGNLNWLKGYGVTIPQASKANSFSGTLDGGNNTIYGLYIVDAKSAGLFPAISSHADIKNLKFDGVHISGARGTAGTIAGQSIYSDWTKTAKITNCAVINATIGEANNIEFVGGFVGDTQGSTITFKNCYAYNLNLSDYKIPGGMVGNCWSDSKINIVNSYSIGYYPVRSTNKNAVCTNVYTDAAAPDGNTTANVTVLTTEQMKGENSKANMQGFDFERTWKTVEGGYPVLFKYVSPDYVWDGSKAESFAGGDGSQSSPFLIENASQLYKLVTEYSTIEKSDGKYFKIVKDIYINEVSETSHFGNLSGNKNWLQGYGVTIAGASKENSFAGTLDGGNNTIYGLYIVDVKSAGLFPAISSHANIKNLAFDGVHISGGKGYGGAISGQAFYSDWVKTAKISNCSLVNATIGESSNIEFVGGFIGDIKSCTVTFTNCYSYNVNLSDYKMPGGIAGNHWTDGTINIVNSYSVGYFPSSSKAKCTNVYTDTAAPEGNTTENVTVLTTEQMKGENAKQYMSGLDYIRSFKTTESYPVHLIYIRPSYIWDGTVAENFAGGTGSAYDPYLIENGAQLYKMVSEYSNASTAKGSNNKVTYFKLIKDIYLNDINENDLKNPNAESFNSMFNSWYTLNGTGKGFCGELDGGNHTVYGLFASGGFAGLIPVLTDSGKVHHINMKYSYVNGSAKGGSAGVIVGYVGGHYTLSPVEVTYSTIDNSVVNGASKMVGGVVGGFEQIKISVSNVSVTRTRLISSNTENPNLTSAFIGNGWGVSGHTVENSFTDSSVHPVTNSTKEADFEANQKNIKYTNVYTSAKKNFNAEGIIYLESDSKLKGKNVADVLKGFNFSEDWFANEKDYPAILDGAGNWLYDTKKAGEVWSGKLARLYASGDGTKESPYEIKTGGQLALLANDALQSKTANKYYKITADIILNEPNFTYRKTEANEWYTGKWAEAFRGNLDGGYHTISGLYLNKDAYSPTGGNYYSGLFACIGKNAVIEKLGIINSSIVFGGDSKYVGAFAGFVDQYDLKEASFEDYPLIRECFADTTVYLDASSCGGFIGCATRPIRVEDSFFTGKVNNTARGLFGYSKLGMPTDEILVKNFYTADSKLAVLSNASYDTVKIENCYSSSAQDKEGLTRLFIDRMCGKEAIQYMTGFDFKNIWAVRGVNETPGLKGFSPDSFSNVMSPEDIVVSFESNCNLLVDSIMGKAYSKLTLPTLSRDGYIFEGWYAFPELDVPFDFDYYPTFDTILYAKWSLAGFEQDFEQYEDSVYDYHEGYEYYRPTTENYSAKYVRGGAKSMHRLAGSKEELDFLLFYKEELEVGKTYKMVYYTSTDQETASVDVSLVYLDWPDVYCKNNGVVKIGTLTDIKGGQWKECTFTFTAKSKWIAIRTNSQDSIYFDDFILYETDEAIKGDNVASKPDNTVQSKPSDEETGSKPQGAVSDNTEESFESENEDSANNDSTKPETEDTESVLTQIEQNPVKPRPDKADNVSANSGVSPIIPIIIVITVLLIGFVIAIILIKKRKAKK